jgi:amidophosphoribosyltransferase
LLTYYGLFALQHRGQESAGIVTSNGPGTEFKRHVEMGLVSQAIKEPDLSKLSGNRAIGHVRYSTTGSSHIKNAQPLMVDCAHGQIAIGHNGNLVNAHLLRAELEAKGSIFSTTVDSEIILHLLAQPNEEGKVLSAMRRIQGAFSLVLLTEQEIIGVRDPHGFRPLMLGQIDVPATTPDGAPTKAWVLSSETCAFDLVGAKLIREVAPGEVVIISHDGTLRSAFPFNPTRKAFCVFEYVYFARPDSIMGDVNVARVRTEMGRQLARETRVEADLVVPVPDSGIYAAMGFGEELGIPYVQAFVRNHYIGRTFLQPSQMIRDFNVRVKLNLIRELVEGKRVVVVDDSIVRGTTAMARVTHLRDAGAKEVHVRVSCPPHKNACHYGIDFPDPKKLIANQYTNQEIAGYLGADSVGYLSVEGMIQATRQPGNSLCTACFTGEYPVPVPEGAGKFIMGKQRLSLAPENNPQEELFQNLR